MKIRRDELSSEQFKNFTALKFLVRKLRFLLGYKRNVVTNKDAVDDIFDRLYGIRLGSKVVDAENDAEVCREIDMFGTTELIILFNNTEAFRAIIDLINLYNEVKSVQDDIRRNSRNNRETSKRTKKRYEELKDYYEESIKDFRKYLGLDKLKSGFTGKYRHLESIRSGKSSKKSPYRKNQNNLFGMMEDESDIDAYIDEKMGSMYDEDDVYHPYSDIDDDDDSYFHPKSASKRRGEGILDGEFGAMLAEAAKPKKKKLQKPPIDEYDLYQSLKERYEPEQKEVKEKPKSESTDLTSKMMDMMMTLLLKGQQQSQPVISNNDSEISKKLDEMSDFMNAIASDMQEVHDFMDNVSETRQRARNIVRNMKKGNSSGIGMGVDELDDDDEEPEPEISEEPKYIQLMKSGCRDYGRLEALAVKHYQSLVDAGTSKDIVDFYEGELDIMLKWISAVCDNDPGRQEAARLELAAYLHKKPEEEEEDEEDGPYLNMSVDDLLDNADTQLDHTPRPSSHPIDEYNDTHAQ